MNFELEGLENLNKSDDEERPVSKTLWVSNEDNEEIDLEDEEQLVIRKGEIYRAYSQKMRLMG